MGYSTWKCVVLEYEVVSCDWTKKCDCLLMIRQTCRVEEISNVNIFSDFQTKRIIRKIGSDIHDI